VNDYCEWIGRRACTETEWERAANGPGPEKRLHPWGDTPVFPGTGFYNGSSENDFIRVYENHDYASVEGVYNLAGNALELVADYYSPYDPPSAGVLENPVGPSDGEFRLARGGSAGFPSSYTTSERMIINADYAESSYDEW
jgi:formylglycine-generating enzyme required for sulfatase activity